MKHKAFILVTSGASIHQKIRHRVDVDTCDPSDRPQAHALDERADDLNALATRQFIHVRHDMNHYAGRQARLHAWSIFCLHYAPASVMMQAEVEIVPMDDDEPTGRAIGGIARANKLSAEQRTGIARRAALARHSPAIKQATHGSPDHPLKIGSIEIPCYVLEDGTRVLSQRGLQTGIGMSTSGGTSGAQRVAQFIASLGEKGIPISDLAVRINNPVHFRGTSGGPTAYGYEATILTDICDAVLAARKAGKLLNSQLRFAEQCELLTRGLARVGIIGLVDEVTGYQRDRAKDALAKILEDFIAKELQPYVPTFPTEFYEQMFRLRGLEYPSTNMRRPQYFGILTNDIIYKRLAPGVLAELKKVTPRTEDGRHKDKLFRRLTSNKGYPKLRELLGSVLTIMDFSNDWHDFMGKLDRRHPRYGSQLTLALDYQREKDDGKGF